MTTKDFTANVISATKVVPDGNFKDSKASGVWDINEALDLIKGGNWPNAANVNPSAFVDALFSTFLYDGTGSAQTITNGIDLSGEGGLVWIKTRTNDVYTGYDGLFFDTERTLGKKLIANSTNAEASLSNGFTAFNSNGFSIGSSVELNSNGEDIVSWTFRKQPRFFDIVTYTGNATARTISHSLGSVPGMIIVKQTSGTKEWRVYHRSLDSSAPEDYYIALQSTNARVDNADTWNDTAPTSSVFSVGSGSVTNQNGETYVAYLFAHNNDDGGFGEPGNQDIIKCGSFTGNGGTQDIDVGFEPQWVMLKNTGNTSNWIIVDMMRNFIVDNSADSSTLRPNTTDSESNSTVGRIGPRPNGFGFINEGGGDLNGNYNIIYMAIRRGGMQTPTAASDVFAIDTYGGTSPTPPLFNSDFPTDMAFYKHKGNTTDFVIGSRLTGTKYLKTNTTDAEATLTNLKWDFQNGYFNATGTISDYVSWMWKRARGYFDVVATTSGSSTVPHNLGVAPELGFWKRRDGDSGLGDWYVSANLNGHGFLNKTDAWAGGSSLNITNLANATHVDTGSSFIGNGYSMIIYLFATVAGVSKVGSYTANGSAQNIDCGFSGGNGARFVLIKRTDNSGHWFLFDTTRGLVSGNDPNLQLNENNAQETTYDHIDPLEAGFTVAVYGDDSPYININGATYIFYAIA
tara:strand:+ start:2058 stop:4115 length:2058 start_codon:yes stop_codon:yes gene_type:complete